MRIAFVGGGYAADLYSRTLPNHPELVLAGVYDLDPGRLKEFSHYHGVTAYASLAALLDDPEVELVVNLTSPASHAEVTTAALLSGKHVYSEKPLALDLVAARRLVELADQCGLLLGSAPCTLLGEAAQTAWRALRAGAIGAPRLAYAELDAGPMAQLPVHTWVSPSGAPWPYLHEFRTGCVIEHAAYCLSWLTAFFGPAVQMTAFAAAVAPNPYVPDAEPRAADFSVACVEFSGGVAARLTCGMVAPKDQSLCIVGDDGVLSIADTGFFDSPVTLAGRQDRERRIVPPVASGRRAGFDQYHRIDFARGVADLAAAVRARKAPHLPVDHALHVLELTLALAHASGGLVMQPETTFAPVAPAASG